MKLKYIFRVINKEEKVIFGSTSESLEMLEEEIGRWERYNKDFIKQFKEKEVQK